MEKTNPFMNQEQIIQFLDEHYGISVGTINKVEGGADPDAKVFSVEAANKQVYFVKVLKGLFSSTGLSIMHHFNQNGINKVIAPILTLTGEMWVKYQTHALIVFPFIQGKNGYEQDFTCQQWVEFGKTMRLVHDLTIPAALRKTLRVENYSPVWRNKLNNYLIKPENILINNPVAAQLKDKLIEKKDSLIKINKITSELAEQVIKSTEDFVLCHGDLHAGNLLITDDGFFIVDWDQPILALKERDLMYPGSALGFTGCDRLEEEKYFLEGYGKTKVNNKIIAFYRFERIIEDVVVFSDQIFTGKAPIKELEQAYFYLTSNFWPSGTIEAAFAADNSL